MLIALDFDGTYTADPPFWDDFIDWVHECGHHVYIVTARDRDLDRLKLEPHFDYLGVNIIYCDGQPKKEITEAKGLRFNVWIDDNPASIFHPSNFQRGAPGLEAWRRSDPHGERPWLTEPQGQEVSPADDRRAGLLPRSAGGGGPDLEGGQRPAQSGSAAALGPREELGS
jgi:hypothetical protein